ncbi:MAG: T9SS type A sorting domain-containing protein [Ignavibacteria bacterium]|nr:T9SS type A sorting domain-containing protein [Ignavibacteria bacterium]
MKKLFTFIALIVVNLALLSGLLKAGTESNNIHIAGCVYHANTTKPVSNAIVKLYLVNSNQLTYKVLESVKTTSKGEYEFVSSTLTPEDKIRIGAYVNDIVEADVMANGHSSQTDEVAELGAYANDITMDRANPLSQIYNSSTLVDLNSVSFSKVNLYIHTEENTFDTFGGGIGTYPKGGPILNQNYPNPFNPTTNIQYGIPQQSYVSLKVYDMSGKLVAELVNEVKEKGYYTVKFDGSKLSSGFYLYKLTAGDFTSIKKMSLIK